MFGSPLGPAGSGGLGDKEPAVDDQLNPSGFVPFSKRDRRGSGVGSRRPPTGSPNHPWRSCSASRRNTTLGNLISLGQCGLNAKTAAISETCRLYFACVLRLAPSIKPRAAASSAAVRGFTLRGCPTGVPWATRSPAPCIVHAGAINLITRYAQLVRRFAFFASRASRNCLSSLVRSRSLSCSA